MQSISADSKDIIFKKAISSEKKKCQKQDYHMDVTNVWVDLDRYVRLDKLNLPTLEDIPLCLRQKRAYYYINKEAKPNTLHTYDISLEIFSKPGSLNGNFSYWPIGTYIKGSKYELLKQNIAEFMGEYKVTIKILKEQKTNTPKKEIVVL